MWTKHLAVTSVQSHGAKSQSPSPNSSAEPSLKSHVGETGAPFRRMRCMPVPQFYVSWWSSLGLLRWREYCDHTGHTQTQTPFDRTAAKSQFLWPTHSEGVLWFFGDAAYSYLLQTLNAFLKSYRDKSQSPWSTHFWSSSAAMPQIVLSYTVETHIQSHKAQQHSPSSTEKWSLRVVIIHHVLLLSPWGWKTFSHRKES